MSLKEERSLPPLPSSTFSHHLPGLLVQQGKFILSQPSSSYQVPPKSSCAQLTWLLVKILRTDSLCVHSVWSRMVFRAKSRDDSDARYCRCTEWVVGKSPVSRITYKAWSPFMKSEEKDSEMISWLPSFIFALLFQVFLPATLWFLCEPGIQRPSAIGRCRFLVISWVYHG